MCSIGVNAANANQDRRDYFERQGRKVKFGSLFAGIGGFDLGFERAGFDATWQVELEPFCRSVLARHFPSAFCFDDIQRCCGLTGEHECERDFHLDPVDVITAGVPCQDVSIAGKRAGLAGERTGLFYEFARILCELRPAWFVFENVPGLFSSNRGRDFAEVLRVLMGECGYGVAWRVLNLQFFGIPQRRRRVLVVGCLGKPCPAEILFERESGGGNFAPRGEKGADVAYALAACAGNSSGRIGQGWNTSYAITENMRNRSQGNGNYVQQAISSKWAKGSSGPAGDEHHNLVCASPISSSAGHHGHSSGRGDGRDNLIAGTIGCRDRGRGPDPSEAASNQLVAAPLTSGSGVTSNNPGRRREDDENIVISENQRGEIRTGRIASQLSAGGGKPGSGYGAVAMPITGHSGWHGEDRDTYIGAPTDAHGVRDFAELPEGLDSARYRALGNAFPPIEAEWIARRILEFGT